MELQDTAVLQVVKDWLSEVRIFDGGVPVGTSTERPYHFSATFDGPTLGQLLCSSILQITRGGLALLTRFSFKWSQVRALLDRTLPPHRNSSWVFECFESGLLKCVVTSAIRVPLGKAMMRVALLMAGVNSKTAFESGAIAELDMGVSCCAASSEPRDDGSCLW